MEDRRIWIKDILFRILCSWRSIVIAMLLGALLLDGLGYMQANKTYHSKLAEQENQSAQESGLAQLESVLTEDEIIAVQSAVAYTEGINNSYTELVEYTNNSIRYQIDPNCVPTIELQYLVESYVEPDNEASDHTHDIIAGYENALQDVTAGEKLAQAIGTDKNAATCQELITVVREDDENILRVQVIADSKENCGKLADVVDEIITARTAQLQKSYSDLTLTSIGRTYMECVNQDLMAEQKAFVTSLQDLINKKAVDPTTGFSAEQKAYYKQLLAGEEAEDNTATESELSKPSLIYPKRIAIGVIFGFVVMCVYLYLKMAFSGVMLSSKDSRERVLAVIPTGKQSRRPLSFVDRWLLKLFYRKDAAASQEVRMDMAVSAAQVAMEQGTMKRICVTGTAADAETKKIKEMLCTRLSAGDRDAASVGSVLSDAAVLPELTEADGIVLVERIGSSCYGDLLAQQEVCQAYKLPVIGCVVLR